MSKYEPKRTLIDFTSLVSRTGAIGLELEVEFIGGVGPTDIGGVWLSKKDDSLINGIEYVTRQPLAFGPKKITHINKLIDVLKESKVKAVETDRGSLHVHINAQKMSLVHIWNAVIAYWLLENCLLHYCGYSKRAGNLFCLRLRDAESITSLCSKDLAGSSPFNTFDEDSVKYSGLNLATLRRFGSLEFRTMRCTLDPKLIDDWSTLCYTIVVNSKKFTDPAELMDTYLEKGLDEFLAMLVPQEFIHLILSVPNSKALIRENAMRLCDLAYFYDDWSLYSKRLDEVEIAHKSAKPILDEIYITSTSSGNFPVSTWA